MIIIAIEVQRLSFHEHVRAETAQREYSYSEMSQFKLR